LQNVQITGKSVVGQFEFFRFEIILGIRFAVLGAKSDCWWFAIFLYVESDHVRMAFTKFTVQAPV